MRVPRLSRLAALAATALLLGACTAGGSSPSAGGNGGGSSPSAGGNGGGSSSAAPASNGGGGSASSLDACKLLTTAEIQSAVGWPVGTGLLQNTDTQTDCEWSQADQTGGVGLIIHDFDASLWQAGSSAGNSTAVSGIGDAAYKGWPHAGDLAIKYKGYEVDVAIIDFQKPAATVDSEVLVLAKLVLSRL